MTIRSHTEIEPIAADIARELRANPKAWTKTWFAKDENGLTVPARSPKAVCWCLAGHIIKRTEYDEIGDVQLLTRLYRQFEDCINPEHPPVLSVWNDNNARTVEDVIATCERVAHISDEDRSGL